MQMRRWIHLALLVFESNLKEALTSISFNPSLRICHRSHRDPLNDRRDQAEYGWSKSDAGRARRDQISSAGWIADRHNCQNQDRGESHSDAHARAGERSISGQIDACWKSHSSLASSGPDATSSGISPMKSSSYLGCCFRIDTTRICSSRDSCRKAIDAMILCPAALQACRSVGNTAAQNSDNSRTRNVPSPRVASLAGLCPPTCCWPWYGMQTAQATSPAKKISGASAGPRMSVAARQVGRRSLCNWLHRKSSGNWCCCQPTATAQQVKLSGAYLCLE